MVLAITWRNLNPWLSRGYLIFPLKRKVGDQWKLVSWGLKGLSLYSEEDYSDYRMDVRLDGDTLKVGSISSNSVSIIHTINGLNWDRLHHGDTDRIWTDGMERRQNLQALLRPWKEWGKRREESASVLGENGCAYFETESTWADGINSCKNQDWMGERGRSGKLCSRALKSRILWGFQMDVSPRKLAKKKW